MLFAPLRQNKNQNLCAFEQIDWNVTVRKLTKMFKLLDQMYFGHSLVPQGTVGQQGPAGIVGVKGDKVEPNISSIQDATY